MTTQQQFHPISMLPVFTDMVDGMLESSLEQFDNMGLVIDKPHVLDDATLKRMITLYTDQLEDQQLFLNQMERWKQEKLSDAELTEVNRLISQSGKLKEINENILKLSRSIEHATIDKIIAMDDEELALSVLSGKIKPPS